MIHVPDLHNIIVQKYTYILHNGFKID